MKKYIFLTGICMAILFACTNDTITTFGDKNFSKIKIRTGFTYEDAGTLHNDGLEAVEESENKWSEMTIEEAVDGLDEILTPMLETEIDCENISSVDLEEFISLILDDHTLGDLDEALDDKIYDMSTNLNSHESNLISRMRTLLDQPFTGLTEAQVSQRIIDSFTVYTYIVSNNPNNFPKKDFRASAYVGLGSANFWHDWSGNTGGDVENFIQVDLVGYLIGWLGAWLDDQGPGYSNSQEAQNRRIGKGLRTGISASTLRMVSVGGSW